MTKFSFIYIEIENEKIFIIISNKYLHNKIAQ